MNLVTAARVALSAVRASIVAYKAIRAALADAPTTAELEDQISEIDEEADRVTAELATIHRKQLDEIS